MIVPLLHLSSPTLHHRSWPSLALAGKNRRLGGRRRRGGTLIPLNTKTLRRALSFAASLQDLLPPLGIAFHHSIGTGRRREGMLGILVSLVVAMAVHPKPPDGVWTIRALVPTILGFKVSAFRRGIGDQGFVFAFWALLLVAAGRKWGNWRF